MAEQLESRVTRHPVPNRYKWRNRILAISGVLVVILSLIAFFSIHRAKSVIDKTYKGTQVNNQDRSLSSLLAAGRPISVLLLGTDTGELGRTDRGRTDSMMLVTINPKTEKTTLISIPRDAVVAVDGYESTFPEKINAAYSLGDTTTAIKTVQDYLNVPVDGYALINMGGLEKMVNQVGGVSVKSPLDFQYSQDTAHSYGPNLYRFHKGSAYYEHSDDNGQTWSASSDVMTGDAALAFSRMRYDDPDGDYGRQQRQRLVLEALIRKASHASNLLNDKFMDTISSNVQTSFTFGDMTKLAQRYSAARNDIETQHLQGETQTIPDSTGKAIYYEVVPTKEKQRITDLVRKELGIKAAETGPMFGGQVPEANQQLAKRLENGANHSEGSDDSSTSQSAGTSGTTPGSNGSTGSPATTYANPGQTYSGTTAPSASARTATSRAAVPTTPSSGRTNTTVSGQRQ